MRGLLALHILTVCAAKSKSKRSGGQVARHITGALGGARGLACHPLTALILYREVQIDVKASIPLTLLE